MEKSCPGFSIWIIKKTTIERPGKAGERTKDRNTKTNCALSPISNAKAERAKSPGDKVYTILLLFKASLLLFFAKVP